MLEAVKNRENPGAKPRWTEAPPNHRLVPKKSDFSNDYTTSVKEKKSTFSPASLSKPSVDNFFLIEPRRGMILRDS